MSTIDRLITPVEIPPFSSKIRYKDPIALIGSCFAEHIDNKLCRYKYNVLSNPFGIVYNSTSIADSLERIFAKKYYVADELVMHDGLFHSMDHHGSYSGSDQESVLGNINSTIDKAHAHLQNTKYVFISIGTTSVYQHKETHRIVANNHKIPLLHFDHRTLSVEDCEKDMNRIYEVLQKLAPEARIIWTVSPVRHTRDGLVENQRSKSTVIVAISRFLKSYTECSYFPSYEIMMDQLRDYRFYSRDLVHPNDVAIDIIWDVFTKTYLDTNETSHHAAIEKITKAREHRFLHDQPNAVKSFAESQLKNIDHLALLYPEMNWKEERQYFFHLIEPD